MRRHVVRDSNGQTLVIVALSLVVLVGMMALAVDIGHLYAERRRLQNAADAGALAGARELCLGRSQATAEAQAREYVVSGNNVQPLRSPSRTT